MVDEWPSESRWCTLLDLDLGLDIAAGSSVGYLDVPDFHAGEGLARAICARGPDGTALITAPSSAALAEAAENDIAPPPDTERLDAEPEPQRQPDPPPQPQPQSQPEPEPEPDPSAVILVRRQPTGPTYIARRNTRTR